MSEPPSQGHTLREAAQELNIAEKTLRNWIRKGKREHEGRSIAWRLVNGPRGQEYRIWLDVAPPAPSPVHLTTDAIPAQMDAFAALVADVVQGRVDGSLSNLATGQAEIASKLESVLSCMMEQADEIAALRADLAYRDRPLWRRFFFRRRK